MRPRLVNRQWVTFRPMAGQESDVFGDPGVLPSKQRLPGFQVKAQMTWMKRVVFGEDGAVGRSSQQIAFAVVLARDVPKAAGPGWEPKVEDVVETAGVGEQTIKLFVSEVQPAFPISPSVRNPSGGFSGWRVGLTDRAPARQAAATYD